MLPFLINVLLESITELFLISTSLFLFQNTATAKKETTKVIDDSLITGAALDSETLNMQQKLIVKQKELLELQQKKIELELLQAQVKFQEQLKNQNVGTDNVLLSKAKVINIK